MAEETKTLYPYHTTSYTTTCFTLAFQALLFLKLPCVFTYPGDMGKYN